MPPRVLVLFNQPVLPLDHPDANSEHDIHLTVENTVKILKAAGFDVRQLGIDYDPRPLLDELRDHRPDAVYNLFEGLATQTGTEVSVAALLEWLNVPFTGSGSMALCVGRDKIRTKHLVSAVGLRTPEYAIVEEPPVPPWPHGWPAIVKPATQDGSVGIDQGAVVTSQDQLDQRVKYVMEKYGAPIIIERFINGREFHVNVIEDCPAQTRGRPLIVVPPAEIAYDPKNAKLWPIYSFAAKWEYLGEEYKAAPLKSGVVLSDDQAAKLHDLSVRTFRLLQCQDYARLDVRTAADGTFYILEVNPNPYLNSPTLIEGLEIIGRTHERFVVDLALAAIARGGKTVPEGVIRVPVGVSTAMDD